MDYTSLRRSTNCKSMFPVDGVSHAQRPWFLQRRWLLNWLRHHACRPHRCAPLQTAELYPLARAIIMSRMLYPSESIANFVVLITGASQWHTRDAGAAALSARNRSTFAVGLLSGFAKLL
jgi:hypothetical protein